MICDLSKVFPAGSRVFFLLGPDPLVVLDEIQ